MSYRVRKAVIEDVPTIIRFQKALALESENLVLDDALVSRGCRIPFERENIATYYVAEWVPDATTTPAAAISSSSPSSSQETTGPQVCSMLMITFEWSDWRGGCIYWIQSVYTDPNHRRKGLFTMLYQHIKDLVDRDESAVAIRLYVEHENVKAMETYKRLGMEVEEGYRMMKWSKIHY